MECPLTTPKLSQFYCLKERPRFPILARSGGSLRRSDVSYQMSEENLTLGATVVGAATDPIRRLTRRSRPENYAACRRVISAKTACPSSVNE
jgi:hypothetical protein